MRNHCGISFHLKKYMLHNSLFLFGLHSYSAEYVFRCCWWIYFACFYWRSVRSVDKINHVALLSLDCFHTPYLFIIMYCSRLLPYRCSCVSPCSSFICHVFFFSVMGFSGKVMLVYVPVVRCGLYLNAIFPHVNVADVLLLRLNYLLFLFIGWVTLYDTYYILHSRVKGSHAEQCWVSQAPWHCAVSQTKVHIALLMKSFSAVNPLVPSSELHYCTVQYFCWTFCWTKFRLELDFGKCIFIFCCKILNDVLWSVLYFTFYMPGYLWNLIWSSVRDTYLVTESWVTVAELGSGRLCFTWTETLSNCLRNVGHQEFLGWWLVDNFIMVKRIR